MQRGNQSLWASALAIGSLIIAILAAVAASIAYWSGYGIEVYGGALALSVFAASVGLVLWARHQMPEEVVTGDREPLASPDKEWGAFAASLSQRHEAISRRRLLLGLMATFISALGIASVSALRSLGPAPFPSLRQTQWAPGRRLVLSNGDPVSADALTVGTVITVFPEGYVEDYASQTLVIRVEPELLQLPAGRQSWAPSGIVAYSKVCTHAGCPVGLYQKTQHLLLCPCHQSAFDVLRGATLITGPAGRPLPQLPLQIDTNGYLVAQSDYQVPIGPGYWSLTS